MDKLWDAHLMIRQVAMEINEPDLCGYCMSYLMNIAQNNNNKKQVEERFMQNPNFYVKELM